MRRSLLALSIITGLAFAASPVLAKGKAPDAILSLSQRSVAVGVGFSWGDGTLTYRGKKYPVSVDGLTVGSVGASKASARGSVYNLKKLEDFNGTYAAVKAGATVGGGASASALKNQNGVRINLTSTSRGVKFTVAAEGVTLKLK